VASLSFQKTDAMLHPFCLSLSLSAASVFAYGQTSSGKTYTMVGITEQSMSDIYDYIDKVIFFGGSEVLN
jgi:hypothetical protein